MSQKVSAKSPVHATFASCEDLTGFGRGAKPQRGIRAHLPLMADPSPALSGSLRNPQTLEFVDEQQEEWSQDAIPGTKGRHLGGFIKADLGNRKGIGRKARIGCINPATSVQISTAEARNASANSAAE